MTGSSTDDNVLLLIKGCRKNDRVSQKMLYKHYYGYSLSITIRYTKNRDDAVEVMNDSFMKVFKNIKKFNTKLSFSAWLRRILINESINNVKRKNTLFKEEQISEGLEYGDQENITQDIGYQEVVEMIQQLPPQYQTVFNLHVMEGFSHREISNMLNIKVGTSKSNLFKAKEKLKVILQGYLEA